MLRLYSTRESVMCVAPIPTCSLILYSARSVASQPSECFSRLSSRSVYAGRSVFDLFVSTPSSSSTIGSQIAAKNSIGTP